ncbi:hypothetical protein [Sphingomonas sp. Leaf38]|jgi:hypothetical protein|uniref:hypothetical protein n=1 Tax=Sphingomonas sp. Leaf38 TaxID=1736217 RepID=UPI000A673431|nr:hypothetical protein [Sphingomonas sp. Leaf38]
MDRRLPPLVIPPNAGISWFGSRRPKRKDTSVRWYDGWGAAVLLPVALAACSPASEPGAVTADEAHQLNEAAAMLDANSVDLNAVVAAPDETAPETDIPSNQSDQTR